jgi:HSP20 family protein
MREGVPPREGERMREEREYERAGERAASEMPPRSTERDYGVHPLDLFRRYTREMDRMFDRMLGGWGFGGSGGMMHWPAIESFDRDDLHFVRAEMPGMKPEDVRVRTVGDTLVIDGERRSETPGERTGARRSEWSYGRFHRELSIPGELDASKMRARMTDGVLEISMPYREGRRAREIEIERGESAREVGRDVGREETSRRGSTRH